MQNMEFDVLSRDRLISTVKVENNKVYLTNHTDGDILLRPFGVNEKPTIKDLEAFFEERCFPRERVNRQEILEALGLMEYNPLEIVKITHAVQLEDYVWIRFKGEDLEYERDIKLRD